MMKLTRQVAQRQAARLQACPMLVPQSDEGRREVVDSLLRNCQSEEHCVAVLTEFLDTALHVQNVTAELAAIARRTQRSDQAPAGCAQCDLGPDPFSGEQRWAAHLAEERGARRCECDRGRWLAAREHERTADSKPRKKGGGLERIRDGKVEAGGEQCR